MLTSLLHHVRVHIVVIGALDARLNGSVPNAIT